MVCRGAALLAVLVVAAGCGGDRDDETTPRRSSTTSTGSATSEATTTSAPGPTCTELAEPVGATDLDSASGDLDGDRRVDELISYRDAAGAWHLRVALAVGGGADVLVPTVGDASVQVLGGADLDGNGTDELWARTGAGASAAIVGLARLVDCSLVQFTFAGGEPAEFAVGGTVGTAAGLQCLAGGRSSVLTTYTATNTGDDRYEVASVEWAIDGYGTTLVAGPSATVTVAATDPLMARASSFSCGDLAL